VTVTVFDETPEAETVTVQFRVTSVLLAVAVNVKLPGVFPLEGDLDSQEQLSEAVHDRVLLLPQFVTLIDRVPPPDGAIQLLSETQSSGGEDCCVIVIVFDETPEAETVTLQYRVTPVLLAATVIVKLLGVVPLVGDNEIQEQLSEAVHDNLLLVQQFVTLIDCVSPLDGTVQLLGGDTQRQGCVSGPCVTVTVFDETPEAETVTVQYRVTPVLLAVAVIVKLPGVVPLVGDNEIQEQLSEAVHDRVLLLPQFVTLIDRVPPPHWGVQLLGDTQRSGGFGFSAVIWTALFPPFDVMSILPLFEPEDIPDLLMETVI